MHGMKVREHESEMNMCWYVGARAERSCSVCDRLENSRPSTRRYVAGTMALRNDLQNCGASLSVTEWSSYRSTVLSSR